ncbi:MAG: SpoVA/SpoVAEb family sporulation membrane protein [Clostridia bacterium]|nr:SpoVA/SpoVAEb family sporulation membrane protein [Clostridia bacterium]
MLVKSLLAFLLGGILCVIVQIIIDKTAVMPPRILVFAVVFGVFLQAIRIFDPIKEIFGCGISVPLVGFGAVLGKGVEEAVSEMGALGILTGPLTAGAAGISAALLFACIAAFFFRSSPKRM